LENVRALLAESGFPMKLTEEMIRDWFESTEKHFRHELIMRDALGLPFNAAYRPPTQEETAEARRHISEAIAGQVVPS
jgi:hypothetical protein